MIRIAIILGSTRPGRVGEGVARWVLDTAQQRPDAEFELVDIAAQDLPLLDEPVPPLMGKYTKEHTKAWSRLIDGFDAFVFVTAEYNHAVPAALKNAIDFLYKEWNDKAAGFVSYGSAGGVRAVEVLRLIMGELRVADVRDQLSLRLGDDFENWKTFKPTAEHAKALNTMLDGVVRWGNAFKQMRDGEAKARASQGAEART